MKYVFIIFAIALSLCVLQVAYGDEANTQAVKQIFKTSCYGCHKPGGTLFDITNVKDLISKNEVQGLDKSKIWIRLNATKDYMPLGGEPLPTDQKTRIFQWLSEGYPSFDDPIVVPPPPPAPLNDNDLASCIRTYGLSLNPVLARNLLPVQISNVYGSSGNDQERLIEAVRKLFNTVSIADVNADSLGKVISCKTDPKSILFLDLRALNQTRARIDQFIVDAGYPYFIDHTGIDGFEEAAADVIDILKIFGSRTVPWVRADWLVDYAAEDPFYSRFLFKDFLVRDLNDFLRFVNLDLEKELFVTNEARAAIFRHSGVTLHNRELQVYPLDLRIASGVTYRSQLWITFDFINDEVGEQHNLFAEPFGPVYSFFEHGLTSFLANKFFIQDASEILFMTPGGLASALFNGPKLGNKPIFFAQQEVAFHPANASPPILGTGHVGFDGKAGTVLNGVSCFACHSGPNGAMNAFVDEGRNHVNLSTDFTNDQVNFFNRTSFHDQGEIEASRKLTNDAFKSAMQAQGAKKLGYVDLEEPVFATSKWYEGDQDICGFGLENGFTCDDIKRALNHTPDLARKLGLSESLAGRASRLNIEQLQAQIAVDLNLGRAVVFKNVEPVCELVIENKTNYAQKFDRLVFTDKTYESFFLGKGKTQKFNHKSDATFDGCLYYRNDRCVVHKNVTLQKCHAFEIVVGSNGYSEIVEK